MKKIGLTFLFLILIFSLASCSGDGAPQGMQLCFGGESEGYSFYAPEGWTLSNVGEVHSAYVSRVNVTSVSFARVKIPSAKPKTLTDEEYFFTSYFADSLGEFPSAPTVTVNGEDAIFGKTGYSADKAKKYVFSYEYDEHKFTCMQILMRHGENFYIFTYNSMNEVRSGDESYYEFYLSMAQKCIEEFKFTDKKATQEETAEFTKDKDGFLLYSNSELCGFDLYFPSDFKLDYSTARVSATHEDGSNVNMTKATSTGVVVSKYWEMRREELSNIVSGIEEIRANEDCVFGNAKNHFCYEYRYTYNGKVFHVYQVLAVKGSSGYVFTYTATEENYALHIDDITKMAEKVTFK